jgi:hypothetical protein
MKFKSACAVNDSTKEKHVVVLVLRKTPDATAGTNVMRRPCEKFTLWQLISQGVPREHRPTIATYAFVVSNLVLIIIRRMLPQRVVLESLSQSIFAKQ